MTFAAAGIAICTSSILANPQPAVDGGDGGASVKLTAEQKALVKTMAKRTQSDPEGDPLTGAELGAGKKKP